MRRLRCERGILGDIQVSLETGGKRISLGSVQSWEDQEAVLRFVNDVNRELCKLNISYVSRKKLAFDV